MNKARTILPVVLKMLLGVVFILSAVLKIFDMDQFEIYIYSYHFFSLNFSYLVARTAIIVELVLGIGLVSNCFHKLMWWGSVVMILGYTLLLIYALVIGRTDNCHCFGDYLRFDPLQSLLKNVVLMVLFALVYKVKGWQFRKQKLALAAVAMAATAAVFLISPPDNFIPNPNEKSLQSEYFGVALKEAPLKDFDLEVGKQVICFFSTGCEYCQMAAHKLSLMQQFYGFPAENITYVFMGSEEGIEKFYEHSESVRYRNVLYEDVHNLLKITNGNFPIIVFLDNGKVVQEYGFRDMKEAEIKAFMAS